MEQIQLSRAQFIRMIRHLLKGFLQTYSTTVTDEKCISNRIPKRLAVRSRLLIITQGILEIFLRLLNAFVNRF